jgi:hypothetical protein
VDVDSGDLAEIAAENGRDLLQPLQTEDGALYYIRKPYESRAASATLATSLKDAALFPFRLGRAILQYFNVFSMMYTGKPLVSSRGAVQRWIDPRQAFIYGNLANAAMMRAPAGDAGENALAPASWELVRRGRDSGSEVVARHVLAFDVAADNSILYSNGAAVMRIDSDGRRDRLFGGEMISKVVAL